MEIILKKIIGGVAVFALVATPFLFQKALAAYPKFGLGSEGTTTSINYSTVIVSGDTSGAEGMPGWMFDSDATISTAYEFNNDRSSIGSGGLYISPISSNASDKFIGELTVDEEIVNMESFRYDFMVGEGRALNQEGQFYLNVYANFTAPSKDNTYDCRYNLVPSIGSTEEFTTTIFDPMLAYNVTQSSTSPFACPSKPSDMHSLSAGSTIHAFEINVGDSTSSDDGLSGYLDNVIFAYGDSVITYDFEMEQVDTVAPALPIHLTPVNGGSLYSTQLDKADWTDAIDNSSLVSYYYEESISPVLSSDGSFVTPLYQSDLLTNSDIVKPETPGGVYYWHVRSVDSAGNLSNWTTASIFASAT